MINTRTGIKVTAAALGLAVTSAVAACGTTGPASAANKAAVSTGPLQAPNLTYGQQSCGYAANFHDGSSIVILLGWQRDCAQAASWLDKDGASWHQEDPVTAGSTQGYSYCDLNGPAGETWASPRSAADTIRSATRQPSSYAPCSRNQGGRKPELKAPH